MSCHETEADKKPSSGGVDETKAAHKNISSEPLRKPLAATTAEGNEEHPSDSDEVEIAMVVHTEPNTLSPQEMAQLVSAMFDGDKTQMANLILSMDMDMPGTIQAEPQTLGIANLYFAGDFENFSNAWLETVNYLNKAMSGDGLLTGGSSTPQTNNHWYPLVPQYPHLRAI